MCLRTELCALRVSVETTSPQKALCNARAANASAICSDTADIHLSVLRMVTLAILGSGLPQNNNLNAAAMVKFTEAINGLQSECLLNAARRRAPTRPTAPKANRKGAFGEHESLGPGWNSVVRVNTVVKDNPQPIQNIPHTGP
jgi:hypothetical protein